MPFKPFLVRLLPSRGGRALSEHHGTYSKLQDLVTIQIHRAMEEHYVSDSESEHDIGADNGGDYASDYGFEPEMRPTTNVRMVFAAGADHASIMRITLPGHGLSVEDILAYLTGMLSGEDVDGSLAPVDGVLTVPMEVVVPELLAMARGLVGFTYSIRRIHQASGEDTLRLDSEYKVFSEDSTLGHRCELRTDGPVSDESVLAISNRISRLCPGGRYMQLAPDFCYNVARKGLRKITTFDYPSTSDLRVNNVERAVRAFNSLCTDRDAQFVQIGDVALRRGYILTLHFVEPVDFGVILKFDAQQEELMPNTKVPAEVRLFGTEIADVLEILNGVHESEQQARAEALPLPEDIAARIINMAL
jgi:hypothetical protein